MENFNNDNSGNRNGAENRTMRPRSRTVMLTPELTGQMRAKIAGIKSGSEKISTVNRSLVEAQTEILEKPLRGDDCATICETQIPLEMEAVEKVGVRAPLANRNSCSSGFVDEPINRSSYDGIAEVIRRNDRSNSNDRMRSNSENRVMGRADINRQVERQQEFSNVESNQGKDFVVLEKLSPLVGFLISFDKNPNGDVFELHVGRMAVTSDDSAHGNFLYLNDESVSPMHAILRIVKDAPLQILDQLSENGTKIITPSGDEQDLAGDKGTATHGDKIKFGDRVFTVCLIPN